MGFVFSIFKVVSVLFLGFLALNCFTEFGSNAQLLPETEGMQPTNQLHFNFFLFCCWCFSLLFWLFNLEFKGKRHENLWGLGVVPFWMEFALFRYWGFGEKIERKVNLYSCLYVYGCQCSCFVFEKDDFLAFKIMLV